MTILIRHAIRYVGKKLASDPELRAKTVAAARVVVVEAKEVARQDDRAKAAGRAVGRVLSKLKDSR